MLDQFFSSLSFVDIFNFCVFLVFSVCYVYQIFYVFVTLTKKPPQLTAKKNHRYAVIVAAGVLFSLFRFPLGEIMWSKNGWRWVKNKKAEGKKILDRSARVPLLVLITSALMLFINCVSEFNEEQKVLKEAETQKAAENAGPKGTYRFFEKGVHTFVVDTIIPYVRNGNTFFLFVSKDNHIVHIRTYDEEMLLTKKGDTLRIKCYETGKCDEADNLNVAIIKKYNP